MFACQEAPTPTRTAFYKLTRLLEFYIFRHRPVHAMRYGPSLKVPDPDQSSWVAEIRLYMGASFALPIFVTVSSRIPYDEIVLLKAHRPLEVGSPKCWFVSGNFPSDST